MTPLGFRRSIACVIALSAIVALRAGQAGASGSANASVTLSTQQVAPGDLLVVHLSGWPDGAVTMSTCGNDARRGSADCDLIGSQAIRTDIDNGPTYEFRVTTPPTPCPCVVRVADTAERSVRTVPVVIDGVLTAPTVGDAAPSSRTLVVSAHLDDPRGLAGKASSAFAGSSRRRLIVRVRNAGSQALDDVTVSGVIGRDRSSGAPVATRTISRLEVGTERVVAMDTTVGFPAWGDYVVYGTASTPSVAAGFAVTTHGDPWALELMIPLALVVVARVLRRRQAARVPLSVEHDTRPPAVLATGPDCSPDVGTRDQLRCASVPYAPIGRVAVPNGAHNDDRAVESLNA